MPHVPGSRASCSNVALRFPTACSFSPLCFEVSLISQVPEENGQTFWPIRKIISPPPLLQIKTKNKTQMHNPFFSPSGILSEKAMAPHSSTLAWKIPGRRSLVGFSPWGSEESDATEQLHFHLSLSCTGEGNGTPLQCSCLENPRDGGAWWAAVYGVAQSWTRLKRLSSSSSWYSLLNI